MMPRFHVECRRAMRGWLGFVELGDGERESATANSKEALFAELTRIVARRMALPPSAFELAESAGKRPLSTRPSFRPVTPSWRPPSITPGAPAKNR